MGYSTSGKIRGAAATQDSQRLWSVSARAVLAALALSCLIQMTVGDGWEMQCCMTDASVRHKRAYIYLG